MMNISIHPYSSNITRTIAIKNASDITTREMTAIVKFPIAAPITIKTTDTIVSARNAYAIRCRI
jgi:serine protease inhibitor